MRCLIGVLVGSVSAVTAVAFLELEATSSTRLMTGASSVRRLLPATEPVDVNVAATVISAAVDSKTDLSFGFFIFSPEQRRSGRAPGPISSVNDGHVSVCRQTHQVRAFSDTNKPGASSAAALPRSSYRWLSHEREKSIFYAAKAFMFTFQQRSDHLRSKKFSTSITAFRCDLLFCPTAPLDKIKDRGAATSAPRRLQP